MKNISILLQHVSFLFHEGCIQSHQKKNILFIILIIILQNCSKMANNSDQCLARNQRLNLNAYVKSILGSTETREPKARAKTTTEGSRLNRTTVMYGDKASHDRTARTCLGPGGALRGSGAEKIVILGDVKLAKPWCNCLGILIWSSREGKLCMA